MSMKAGSELGEGPALISPLPDSHDLYRLSAMSTKALNAILPLIAAGSPYEAHQKARTFASRYSKSGQYDTAIDVLFQSARELLKAGQPGSATDLGGFLLDVYETKGQDVSDESRGACSSFLSNITTRPQALTLTCLRKDHTADRAHWP
jgi:hypothetical protein